MDAAGIFEELAVTGTAFAAPIRGAGLGVDAGRPMSPASVAKIQIALAVGDAIATATLDGSRQRITGDLRSLLDEMAREAGFGDYAAMAGSDPAEAPRIRQSLHTSAALDPGRGWATTAADTVRLLQAIWTDTAGAPAACASVRESMARQLTRHRIAAGFPPGVSIAAKSGGLMGLIRNEAAVVTFPDGQQYAVAVFTRSTPETTTDPSRIDAGIGRAGRALVDELRG